jgi:hypothetical protein
MYIMKRLSGGRGEYEIAEAFEGKSPQDLRGRELFLQTGAYGERPTGLELREQGGKLRLRRQRSTTVHIHRQIEATLLLPKSIRDEARLTTGYPVVHRDRYVMRRMEIAALDIRATDATLGLGDLILSNQSAAEIVGFPVRMARVERLHASSGSFPKPLAGALGTHRSFLDSGRPLTATAEQAVERLMRLAEEQALPHGLKYEFGHDVVPILERMIDLPSLEAAIAPAAPESLGETYRVADEEATITGIDPFEVDPAMRERALRGHAATQNALAKYLRDRGLEPRSPRANEPNFDLAWEEGGRVCVAEVKSLTTSNEENQMRLGLGQVLRYAYLLSTGGRRVQGVLALERRPTDQTWEEICGSLRIILVWPGAFDRFEARGSG